VDISKLENGVRWLQINDELRRRYHRFRRAALRRPKGSMNRAMTALETRFLDSFSDDLTLLAGRGYTEMCLDREKEFEEIFRIIEGEGRSVILVGERGVGKDILLHGLAWRMIEDEVPSLLRDKRLVSLSIPKLISGATPTEAAERLMNCFYDIARAGNVVLAVPDIHNLIGLTAGEEGAIDLGDVFTSELEKGYFLVIATSNPQDYTQRIEGTALGNALQKVEIPEPETNQAIQILESKVGVIEYQTKVYFSYEALEKAVVLSQRLIHEKFLPQKAIEIIKETAQFVRSKRGAHQIVTGEDIAYIISQRTKIPVTAVTETESEKLLHLEQIMHERIVGQDEAVKAVASALRRARMELRETKRPIANFLFLGPTGVGKTETAKTLAEVYFGNENQMIRLDMSEYQTKEAVYRLIGLPGEAGGLLTEAVRKNPFSLLLLDEIEKAHPDILNLFLQVMDDGRLTDSIGRVIDFTNIILIATSNAGTSYIQEELKKGRPVEEIKKELVERELKDVFRPEFLNRFDAIVVFKPLAEQEIFQIAKLMLKKIAKQLETKGIFFEATDEAVAELAAAGFDPLFGARPLRRIIQERVQDSLANFLLTQKIERRDKIILEKGGMLRIEKARKW
jgi:ATP-dependent Clp protease ATP-binding subunit ClpC